MKNAYAEMKKLQQERVNALPLMFAFSQQQFNEGMARLGLEPTDTHLITSIGAGGFIRKADVKLFHDTMEALEIEAQAAIDEDTDGTGFIKDMFLYELANHEYCITYDLEPTLDALNLTEDQVMEDPRLIKGLKLAREEYLRNCDEH
jgi:hypothetical protein